MIKAIIFDCFGVLYQGSLEHLYDICPDANRPALRDLSHASDYGYISREEFLQQAAGLLQLSVKQISEVINVSHIRHEPLLEYIRTLHQSHRIALLSNIGSEVISRLFTAEELSELFDVTVLSSDIGAVKPAAEVYEYTAMQLGVAPEECVMIDDSERNVTGAQYVGMQGILYTNMTQLKRELSSLINCC